MHLQKEFVPYPYFIMYDFKALLTALQSAQTSHLMLASTHIPVSTAVNDNLTNKPIFLENVDPETLIQLFVEELAIGNKSSLCGFGACIPCKKLTACLNESKVGGRLG